jgi:hypothetical protein
MSNLDLLLAHFDDRKPALEEGLPFDTAADGPPPLEDDEPIAISYDRSDPDSLPHQRWGIVAPQGPEGDRLLSLIAPLQKHREHQQDAPAMIYRVPQDMSAEASASWWNEVYFNEEVREVDRPRYLLLLGDADLVSWELQQRVAGGNFAGRLTFPNDQGYEAYCAKVLAQEKASPAPGARAVFYTVRDGTNATRNGYRGFVAPTVETIRAALQCGKFRAQEIVELGDDSNVDMSGLFAAFADRQPTMLFTMSHGLGAPNGKGWSSVEEQRLFQGAMSLGYDKQITRDDVVNKPFLPGGVWFYYASFGAGTPRTSAYASWLAKIDQAGTFPGSLAYLHELLPKDGQSPFVAALPQAALANPDGPLAVLGHVDLAWTYAFPDSTEKGKRNGSFYGAFRALVEGKRVGCGFHELQRAFIEASTDLTYIHDFEERARRRGLPPDDENTARLKKMKKANLWMVRQDLAAHVLLGDPAARLNIGA